MSQRLIIFDFDGVIADSLEASVNIAAAAFRKIEHSRSFSHEDIRGTDDMEWGEIAQRLEIPEDVFPRLKQEILAILPDFADEIRPFKGMPEALRQLALTNKLAIVSSNFSGLVSGFLERHGLGDLQIPVFGADQDGPKSDKIQRAAALSCVEIVNTIFVGDTISDIREARAAGVRCIAVSWGFHDVLRLSAEDPAAIVDSPSELLEILEIGG